MPCPPFALWSASSIRQHLVSRHRLPCTTSSTRFADPYGPASSDFIHSHRKIQQRTHQRRMQGEKMKGAEVAAGQSWRKWIDCTAGFGRADVNPAYASRRGHLSLPWERERSGDLTPGSLGSKFTKLVIVAGVMRPWTLLSEYLDSPLAVCTDERRRVLWNP